MKVWWVIITQAYTESSLKVTVLMHSDFSSTIGDVGLIPPGPGQKKIVCDICVLWERSQFVFLKPDKIEYPKS